VGRDRGGTERAEQGRGPRVLAVGRARRAVLPQRLQRLRHCSQKGLRRRGQDQVNI
jgi:hypothetical protein